MNITQRGDIFNPTAGVENEVEWNFYIDAGTPEQRLYLNGATLGTPSTFTATRDDNNIPTLIKIGTNWNNTNTSDFEILDVRRFSTVQHTASTYVLGSEPFTYDTTNPTIGSNPGSGINMDAVDKFAAVESNLAGSSVKHVLTPDSQDIYENGSIWTNSSSFAESNTTAGIEAKKATAVTSGVNMIFSKTYLNSDGYIQAWIESVTIDYNFFDPLPGTINKCFVSAYIQDFVQGIDLSDPDTSAKLIFESNDAFFHTDDIIGIIRFEAAFSDAGYVEIESIETATISQLISIRIEITHIRGVTKIFFVPVVIPNQSSITLKTLTTIDYTLKQ